MNGRLAIALAICVLLPADVSNAATVKTTTPTTITPKVMRPTTSNPPPPQINGAKVNGLVPNKLTGPRSNNRAMGGTKPMINGVGPADATAAGSPTR